VQDSEDQRAIQDVVADWISANKRGDTQAVLDLMADDAVFMVSGQPSMTKVAFSAACAVRAEEGLTFEGTSEIKEIRVEGTMAYSVSHLTVTTGTRAGAILRRSFRTLTVFRKVDGRWLIARDANVSASA
jgi:uncharacterized protein (TIGR02246 family)